MKGNNFTRLGRLLAHLASHPQDIPSYLTAGPFSAKGPLELELPWFSLAAIRFLDSYVTKSMDVFEYGSGGSTAYFAKRAKSVVSTEDDEAWFERVRKYLSAQRMSANVELQSRPYDFHQAEGFEQSEYLNSIPERTFDIIVVDGMEWEVPVRATCFHHAESRIAPGGIIIIDDSWKYTALRSANRAKSYREFRSTGPCRAGATSTDIYFY